MVRLSRAVCSGCAVSPGKRQGAIPACELAVGQTEGKKLLGRGVQIAGQIRVRAVVYTFKEARARVCAIACVRMHVYS